MPGIVAQIVDNSGKRIRMAVLNSRTVVSYSDILHKILVEADDFTPIAPNGPPPAPRALAFTKNLNANIERLKLDVQTIAPLHGFVVPAA